MGERRPPDDQLVPYALDRLIDRAPHMYVCEGPPDCEVLLHDGLAATTNPYGALAWKDRYTTLLITLLGVELAVVLRDHDKPGRDRAETIARSFAAHGIEVRVPNLPDLHDGPVPDNHGRDLRDWLNAGHTLDELRQIVVQTPAWSPTGPLLESSKPTPALIGYTLAELVHVVFPPRRTIFTRTGEPVLRAGDVGEMYAPTGVGKTWLLESLALVAACGGEVLGFVAAEPCRVLYIDGEMVSDDVKQRFVNLCEKLRLPFSENLTIVARDWQEFFMPRLDTLEGKALIEPFIAPADLIIFDNRSCLFDPEGEKDPAAWQPAQDLLLTLRRRSKVGMLAHHTNRAGGARGLSKPEDVMNLLVHLARPDDYRDEQGARFTVTFDKHRGFFGASAAPFVAHLRPDGWHVEGAAGASLESRLLDFIGARQRADDPVCSANQAVSGIKGNKKRALETLAQLVQRGRIVRDGKAYLLPNGKRS
jgi:AAA domain